MSEFLVWPEDEGHVPFISMTILYYRDWLHSLCGDSSRARKPLAKEVCICRNGLRVFNSIQHIYLKPAHNTTNNTILTNTVTWFEKGMDEANAYGVAPNCLWRLVDPFKCKTLPPPPSSPLQRCSCLTGLWTRCSLRPSCCYRSTNSDRGPTKSQN